MNLVLILIFILLILLFIYYIIYLIRTRHSMKYHIRYLLTQTCKALNNANVEYWIDFGSLLGIYRENDIIEGDNDGDICIIGENKEKMKKVKEELNKLNIKLYREKTWDAYCCKYKYFHNSSIHGFIDIYINKINKENDTYIGATGVNSNISKKFIKNTKKYKWNGIYINVPEDINGTLIWRYGEDYMIPKPGFKGRDS